MSVTVPAIDDRTISTLARHSIRLITSLQTPEGAYPASPTFSAYVGYSWLRDGAFIADAASAAGRADSASRFFDWCADVITRRGDAIRAIVRESRAGRQPASEHMLPARFTFAGDDGADEWWDFQLDGYGTWLWALSQHVERHSLDAERWRPAVALTVEYLLASWERPCYDWWEEHAQHVHVSTLACIVGGLDAIARAGLVDESLADGIRSESAAIHRLIAGRGTADGHLIKWLGSTAVDGSLAAAIAPLHVIDPESDLARRTIDVLEAHLCVAGGVHRYLGDTFFGGGQWPLLSCFLGLAHVAAGDRDRASELFDWAAGTATADFDLPEQVGDHLIAPGMRQEWIDRWGPVATPLLWSHAMFLRLGIELGRIAPAELAFAEEGFVR
ncbi:glycoside hydrolase family 15 protein [Microbacterium sp. ASV49]|uniref:Glycoside hydrolase family 15 protein n=1 Tax=Microbacterium candidum TaxID=3041922 RepID=A0ABT7N2J7_9MICO|nr:glycoside hydrolase family 15 protein [Microbacterium sp. ASV49]MDL9980946.1 glycoside hydrolase family 15 protein [Microbacterium sp. ASV49]